MRRTPLASLRWRFVLVLILGAIVPLGVLGFWLVRSTERSGEQLLRARLERSLTEMAEEVGRNWVSHRSNLIEITELTGVQRGLSEGDAEAGGSRGPSSDPAATELDAPGRTETHERLRAAFEPLQEDVRRLVIRDASGTDHWTLRSMSDGEAVPARPEPLVPVEVGIYDRDGRRRGTLSAQLRLGSLLSTGTGQPSVAGSMLGLFDGSTGEAILPLGIDASLFRQPRFVWAGESWIGASRRLTDPAIELVLAAPVGPFREPFAQATRRGTVVLLAVTAASLALVTLVTTRLTRSLRELATAAHAVAEGELDTSVPTGGSAEVERVAEAFNTMTERLRRTLDQLASREALAAVGKFAAALAHEVRNPLSAIRVNLQRAEERMDDSPDRTLVGRALGSIERLERTVTGALRVARGGRVTLEPLDLHTVLVGAIKSAEPEFARRGLRLETELASQRGLRVLGDAAALEQVFLNLLLNAAQASVAGSRVRVRARREGVRTEVEVWDEGAGFSQEALERAFEPFFSTKSEGTGLGLAVARQIVSAHGGEIVIDRRATAGTIVRVRLPTGGDSTVRS